MREQITPATELCRYWLRNCRVSPRFQFFCFVAQVGLNPIFAILADETRLPALKMSQLSRYQSPNSITVWLNGELGVTMVGDGGAYNLRGNAG